MAQDRRQFVKGLGAPLLAASGIANAFFAMSVRAQTASTVATPSKTSGSIKGNQYFINGKPTYAGRVFQGFRVEGLLFESRMVNAIVDGDNPAIRGLWAYPDGTWDPECNTKEFSANLPHYRARGLTSVAFNIQGSHPQGYGLHQPWQLTGFQSDSTLMPDYRARLIRVIEAADALGMIITLSMFYVAGKAVFTDVEAVILAADSVTGPLCDGGYQNFIIEIGNEVSERWKYKILRPSGGHILIARIQKGPLGDVTRRRSCWWWTPTSDDVCIQIEEIRKKHGYRGQPILYIEDDHCDFDKPDNDMAAATGRYVAWGLFDYRYISEGCNFGLPRNEGALCRRLPEPSRRLGNRFCARKRLFRQARRSHRWATAAMINGMQNTPENRIKKWRGK